MSHVSRRTVETSVSYRAPSFVDRAKDTLKVSGVQVSPTEVEDTLLAHPDKLITDVCVAGVSGGRTSDEKNPRAWLVLSDEGKRRGADETIKVLDAWVKKNLSSYKWLRGGYEIVDSVRVFPYSSKDRLLIDRLRYRRTPLVKSCVVCCRIGTKRSLQLQKLNFSWRCCILQHTCYLSVCISASDKFLYTRVQYGVS